MHAFSAVADLFMWPAQFGQKLVLGTRDINSRDRDVSPQHWDWDVEFLMSCWYFSRPRPQPCSLPPANVAWWCFQSMCLSVWCSVFWKHQS